MKKQMFSSFFLPFLLSVGCLLSPLPSLSSPVHAEELDTIYGLKGKTLSGQPRSFADYKGKVLLVTNISLRCGTTPQLRAMQKLHEQYHDKGLVVMAFPSNDFTGESLDDHGKITKFCKKNFGVTFPIFQPGHIKGSKKQPVFDFLTTSGEEETQGEIEFNAEKFLVSKDGKVSMRFGPFTSVTSDAFLERLLELLEA